MKPKAVKYKIAAKSGSYSLAVTALVLAILIAINILAKLLPASVTSFDISSSQLYSITSGTKAVVNHLEDDVTIYWIVQADEEDEVIENLLSRYESQSSHIKVEKKNPDAYPTFTAQYTDEDVPNNSLVVECGTKYRYISYNDIYLADIDYSTYSYVYSFDGEGAITSAISYVVSDDLPVLYVLEGHGEQELPDEFKSQLEKENIELKSLSLLTENAVPEDADGVMIYTPTSDISTEEADILREHIAAGGSLLVMAGPTEDGTLTNLYSILEDYSITAADGIVVEDDSQYYAFQQPYILLPELQTSDITDPLIEKNYYAIMPIAQGLIVGDTDAGTVTSLFNTSDTAFAKAAGYELDTYEKEDGDTDGPFSLGVSIEDNGGGKIVWFSSQSFLEDVYNAYSSGANIDVAMNALSYLVSESQTLAIRTKSLGYNYLTISDAEASILKVWCVGVIPGMFLVYGIITVIDRRRKRRHGA